MRASKKVCIKTRSNSNRFAPLATDSEVSEQIRASDDDCTESDCDELTSSVKKTSSDEKSTCDKNISSDEKTSSVEKTSSDEMISSDEKSTSNHEKTACSNRFAALATDDDCTESDCHEFTSSVEQTPSEEMISSDEKSTSSGEKNSSDEMALHDHHAHHQHQVRQVRQLLTTLKEEMLLHRHECKQMRNQCILPAG